MRNISSMVREFHTKYGFPLDRNLSKEGLGDSADSLTNANLASLGETIGRMAEDAKKAGILLQDRGDGRLYRAHLMAEEKSEAILELAARDEVKLARELADVVITAFGTAENYNIPLHDIIEEVHRSNMTKLRTPDDTRMKSKSHSGYSAPDIKGALEKARSRREWEKELFQVESSPGSPVGISGSELVFRPRERDTITEE